MFLLFQFTLKLFSSSINSELKKERKKVSLTTLNGTLEREEKFIVVCKIKRMDQKYSELRSKKCKNLGLKYLLRTQYWHFMQSQGA